MIKKLTDLALTVVSNDFEELCENFEGWDQQYDLADSGGFRGRMTVTDLTGVQLSRLEWGNSIRYHGTPPKGTVATALPLFETGGGRWMGRTLGADDLLVQAPGTESVFVSAKQWDGVVLSLPVEHYEALSKIYAGDRIDRYRNPQGAVRLLKEDADDIRRQAIAYFGLLATGPADGASDTHIKQLELMAKQISLSHVLAVERSIANKKVCTRLNRPEKVVRQAEEYLLGHPAQNVGVTELCTALGVGERPLHASFMAARGVSPIAWLRRLRLNAVHRQLRAADPQWGAVKRAALDNGFTHFGHFSKQYFKLFGETPATTLGAA